MSPPPQVLPCSQPSALVWPSWKEVLGPLVEPFREWGKASGAEGCARGPQRLCPLLSLHRAPCSLAHLCFTLEIGRLFARN